MVIPEQSDQIQNRENMGSLAVASPSTSPRTTTKNRNVVYRAFNHFKNWRGLASSYGKYALVYRVGVALAAIVLWLS